MLREELFVCLGVLHVAVPPSIRNINPFPPRPDKTGPFVILLVKVWFLGGKGLIL